MSRTATLLAAAVASLIVIHPARGDAPQPAISGDGVLLACSVPGFEADGFDVAISAEGARVRLPGPRVPSAHHGHDNWFELTTERSDEGHLSGHVRVGPFEHPALSIDRENGAFRYDDVLQTVIGRCRPAGADQVAMVGQGPAPRRF